MDRSVLEKKSSFKMLGLTLSSKLDWGLLKLPLRKLEPWIAPWRFFLSRLLYISINLPYYHALNTVVSGAPSCYLELLEKEITTKKKCRSVGPSLAASLEPLAHRQNVGSLNFIYRHYFGGRCSSELAELVSLPYFQGRSTHYSDSLYGHLYKMTTRLKQPMLSLPRPIPIQLLLCKTTTCLTRPVTSFVPQMKKDLSKTTTAKIYPAKKYWRNAYKINISLIKFTLLLTYNAKFV